MKINNLPFLGVLMVSDIREFDLEKALKEISEATNSAELQVIKLAI